MIQVLHLLSRDSDLQARRSAELIGRALHDDIALTTQTIGTGGDYRNAIHAATSLRFGRGALFDVVHAWDTQSLSAAVFGPSPVIYSPSLPPYRLMRWLRGALVYRKGLVIATGNAMRQSLIRRGVPAQRCEVIAPALDFPRLLPGRNEVLRTALGFTPNDRVALAPGESIRAAGHSMAVHVMSILHVLDERYRLLLWGRGHAAGGDMPKKLRQPGLVIAAERRLGRRIEFEELLGAADVALVTAPGVAPLLPITQCMGAGLPIVSSVTTAMTELLEDGRTASLAPRRAPRLLAYRVLELFENPNRSASLAKAATPEVRHRFDPRPFAVSYLSLYNHSAGIAMKNAGRLPSDRPSDASGPSTRTGQLHGIG